VLNGAETQRREGKALQALTHRRAVQLERNRGPTLGSAGQEEGDRPVIEPADGKAEHLRRSGVEPLHVVYGDHQRALVGEPPERTEDGEPDTLLIGRMIVFVFE
jgi:hypothetical protein